MAESAALLVDGVYVERSDGSDVPLDNVRRRNETTFSNTGRIRESGAKHTATYKQSTAWKNLVNWREMVGPETGGYRAFLPFRSGL